MNASPPPYDEERAKLETYLEEMRAEQATDIARREEESKREEAARLNAVEELEKVSAQAKMTRAASIQERPRSESTEKDAGNEQKDASSRGPTVLSPTTPQQVPKKLPPLAHKLPPPPPPQPSSSQKTVSSTRSLVPAPPPPGPDDQKPPWDYFVSHVQSETGSYAVDMWSSLRALGSKVGRGGLLRGRHVSLVFFSHTRTLVA